MAGLIGMLHLKNSIEKRIKYYFTNSAGMACPMLFRTLLYSVRESLIYFYFYVWYFWSINRWALEELLSNFILDIWIKIKLKYSPSSNRCWLSDDVQLFQQPAKENKIWDRCWIAGELAQTGLSVQNELIYRIKLVIRFDYTQWWLN